ncbi:hypothetical protein MNBD_ALPHA06-1298 [hydrothermal vent metagenome]|uniref:Uncharacterized protein n=1 Tax=hydrothermal vent metagenome TaxID=652676 RepID=A0A3B0SR59_9ZZZZ
MTYSPSRRRVLAAFAATGLFAAKPAMAEEETILCPSGTLGDWEYSANATSLTLRSTTQIHWQVTDKQDTSTQGLEITVSYLDMSEPEKITAIRVRMRPVPFEVPGPNGPLVTVFADKGFHKYASVLAASSVDGSNATQICERLNATWVVTSSNESKLAYCETEEADEMANLWSKIKKEGALMLSLYVAPADKWERIEVGISSTAGIRPALDAAVKARDSEALRRENGEKQCGADCYLTTACCDAIGLDDDCWELTQLRRFRDVELIKLPGGRREIKQYYQSAPAIVSKLLRRNNARTRLLRLYWQYILPSAILARIGANRLSRILYRSMLRHLADTV